MTYLRPTALGLAFGILWAFGLLFFFITSTFWGYGKELVDMMNKFYFLGGITNVWLHAVIGTGLAFLDGFIGGVLLAWLYNKFS